MPDHFFKPWCLILTLSNLSHFIFIHLFVFAFSLVNLLTNINIQFYHSNDTKWTNKLKLKPHKQSKSFTENSAMARLRDILKLWSSAQTTRLRTKVQGWTWARLWCSRRSLFAFPLLNRSKGHGSGCTTALNGMHCYLYSVCCQTPPPLYSDNTQNLHRSTVELIPRQCPHPNLCCSLCAPDCSQPRSPSWEATSQKTIYL